MWNLIGFLWFLLSFLLILGTLHGFFIVLYCCYVLFLLNKKELKLKKKKKVAQCQIAKKWSGYEEGKPTEGQVVNLPKNWKVSYVHLSYCYATILQSPKTGLSCLVGRSYIPFYTQTCFMHLVSSYTLVWIPRR